MFRAPSGALWQHMMVRSPRGGPVRTEDNSEKGKNQDRGETSPQAGEEGTESYSVAQPWRAGANPLLAGLRLNPAAEGAPGSVPRLAVDVTAQRERFRHRRGWH